LPIEVGLSNASINDSDVRHGATDPGDEGSPKSSSPESQSEAATIENLVRDRSNTADPMAYDSTTMASLVANGPPIVSEDCSTAAEDSSNTKAPLHSVSFADLNKSEDEKEGASKSESDSESGITDFSETDTEKEDNEGDLPLYPSDTDEEALADQDRREFTLKKTRNPKLTIGEYRCNFSRHSCPDLRYKRIKKCTVSRIKPKERIWMVSFCSVCRHMRTNPR
jgi:hypothetical protein